MYQVICKACLVGRSFTTSQELEAWLGVHALKHVNDAALRGYASSTLELKFIEDFNLEITEIRA